MSGSIRMLDRPMCSRWSDKALIAAVRGLAQAWQSGEAAAVCHPPSSAHHMVPPAHLDDLPMDKPTTNLPCSAAEQPAQQNLVREETSPKPQVNYKETKRKDWTVEKTAAVVSAAASVFRALMDLLRHN